MVPQRVGGAEAGGCRHLLDRHLGRFQQPTRLTHTSLEDPFARRCAGRLLDPTNKGPPAHSCLCREAGDRQIMVEMLTCPGEDIAERIALNRHRPGDELRLSAIAVGCDDETPRDLICDLSPKVSADDVQAQIEARDPPRSESHPRRRRGHSGRR